MSTAHWDDPPCTHGVIDGVCYHCTIKKSGLLFALMTFIRAWRGRRP